MNPLGKSASLSKQPFRVAPLFPASPCKKRVYSVWAGKESILSLDDGAYTHIIWTVKLALVDLALAVMYGLVAVIHAKRIAP
jgi:hypothetical protein